MRYTWYSIFYSYFIFIFWFYTWYIISFNSFIITPYFLDAKTWVLRLPQAILGVLSCYIFYRSLKICYNKNTALIGFLIITIIPWHIVQSRWGLESSAWTFGMLTGFYFYLKALVLMNFYPIIERSWLIIKNFCESIRIKPLN